MRGKRGVMGSGSGTREGEISRRIRRMKRETMTAPISMI
jgi:hypothetical protein